MNYKRHFFWANVAQMVAFLIGGVAWLVEAGIAMKSANSVSQLPYGPIVLKMFAYPTIACVLAWALFRFPLMPRCEQCGRKLSYRRQKTHVYVCENCRRTFDTGERVTGAGE